VVAAALSLHDAMDPFGRADVRDGQPRYGGAGTETIDFFVCRHQRQKIVDALFGRKRGIPERVIRGLCSDRRQDGERGD
jgi:hypothetical protein